MFNNFINNINNLLGRYESHPEAVVISCYFNPQKSEYRTKAFNYFYNSIKHLNHRIIECVIGDTEPELPENKNITRVYTENLLWHKEALLNKIISELPPKFKYIFWVDADIIFTNKSWLTESVRKLKSNTVILQPFDTCVHLDKDELKPSVDIKKLIGNSDTPNKIYNKVWRSFGFNFCTSYFNRNSEDYNTHGHVGFAWGAVRDILTLVPLYDKALIGGADHIIAHAAAGQTNHSCIKKAFSETIDEVKEWSVKFSQVVNFRLGYTKGMIYHIWHGDVEKRQYLKRVKDFDKKIKTINKKDKNGLYITDDDTYVKKYFSEREVIKDDSFLTSVMIGYATNDGLIGGMVGGNIIGGMVGDMLNTNEKDLNNTEFGNGDFGGAGAGGSWENENFS